MARPHILFLQSQTLPWTASLATVREGVLCKRLSEDDASGAATLIVQYPPGYLLEQAHAVAADEEWFVLDGELSLDTVDYGFHDYAYLPAGLPRRRLSSPRGAVVLTMFGSAPTLATSTEPGFDAARLIRRIASFDLPWKTGAEGSVTGKPLGPGLAVKHLRRDLATGEQSFLYACLPHHPPPPIMVGRFTHPMIEEIFALAGEYVFADVGVMRAGGYCWWREGEWHGPAGSRFGYCLFIRVLGGALRNQFATEAAPFRYDPPYRPALPPELAPTLERVPRWPQRW